MNWEIGRLWDICHVADIYFGKVNRFVSDGWSGWWQRGAVFLGFDLLYEEITYIIPQAVKIFTNCSIQLYLPYLSTFLFIVDVIWKTRRNKIADFVDKGIFFIDGFVLIGLTRFFFFI